MNMKLLMAVALAGLAAGCARESSPRVAVAQPVARPAAAPAYRAPAPVQRAPAESLAEPSEAVWHLRAGLNVAALTCRGKGRAPVSPGYTRLLARHKSLLASAYNQEKKRHGGGLDRHLTKVYNRFAYQPKPEVFCREAAATLAEANALDSPGLARAAPKLLSRLD